MIPSVHPSMSMDGDHKKGEKSLLTRSDRTSKYVGIALMNFFFISVL